MKRLLLCPLILVPVSVMFAQTEQTSITGNVTDSSKAIVPDAGVTVRNVATHVTTKTVTNSAGRWFRE